MVKRLGNWVIGVMLLTAAVAAYADDENGEKSGTFAVTQFLTEQLRTPEGIDTPQPRFSWKLAADANNETQSAYELTLSLTETGESVWDSGRVESDQQTFVPYTGEPLSPKTDYTVELTVWNKDGAASDTVLSGFSTGIWETEADPNPWKGKWIGINDAKNADSVDISAANWIAYENTLALPIGRSIYRKSFEVADPAAVKGTIYLTGDNSCRICLNGKEIGRANNFTMATSLPIPELRTGKNVVAVEAENGGEGPNPGGIIGVILLDNGGEQTQIVTDDSWKAVSGNDDAWLAADFDDSAWGNAAVLGPCGMAPWNQVTARQYIPDSIPARYLAKQVSLPCGTDKPVKRAVAYIAGAGYYELYLDGVKIGDHVLDPVLTEYNRRIAYNTYDVTDYIQYAQRSGEWANRKLIPGETADSPALALGVVLGSSRYYAPRQNGSAKTFGLPAVLFQLEVEYADGTAETFVSDESWKGTADGPITANNDYDGEIFDARKSVPFESVSPDNYYEIRFGDCRAVPAVQPVDLMPAPEGKLVSGMMPPMRVNAELNPIAFSEVKPGVWVYDFGQNFVGWCRLVVKGDAGTEVTLRFAETLKTDGDDAGMIYTANLRGAKCTDQFILADSDQTQYYEPRFTYHGFRYVELTGFPGTPTLETLTGCVVGTDLPVVGRFECSNETISKFVKNIEWGTRGNYLSIPTDCPQRDERHGWQGDRAVGSKSEMYMFDNITLYRKWLQDIEDTQREDGNVSNVAPSYWQLYDTNVTWPSAMTIVPDSLYTMYGDTDAIVKHYDSRKKWLNHLAGFLKEDGTLDKDLYGDWCVPPEDPILIHSQDPARKTDPGFLATVYYVYNLQLMAKDAKMLGKTEDEQEFLNRASAAADALNKVYYNAEKGYYCNGTQTSAVLPLAFGLVPEENRATVFASLVNNIENITNRHLGTGLIGGQWLNRVLSDNGRIDLSYEFATNTTYPSWGYMIERGATTVWELWNGDTADPAMNSGNHVMLIGDIGIWYFEYLAGIKADPENPGFKHIIMKPNVLKGHPANEATNQPAVDDLNWVDAEYMSVRGPVASSWEVDKESKKFVWTVGIPVNATATLYVPTTNPETAQLFGADEEPITAAKTEDGRAVFEIGSGLWQVIADWE